MREIKNLTSSYLECCAENDRLRKIEDGALKFSKSQATQAMPHPDEQKLFDALMDNPRPSE